MLGRCAWQPSTTNCSSRSMPWPTSRGEQVDTTQVMSWSWIYVQQYSTAALFNCSRQAGLSVRARAGVARCLVIVRRSLKVPLTP